MKNILFALLCVLFAAAPELALAGGLDSGTQAADQFKTWFFSFLAIVAAIYLAWQGVMLFGHKIQWIDFGEAVGKVAVVGSVIGLATWAWSVFA